MNNIKKDRNEILNFLGLKKWNIFLRKYNKIKFSNYRYSFESYIRGHNTTSFEKYNYPKVSLEFIDKYKDIFPNLIKNVLENPNYTHSELIFIIENYPDYISWYHIFYNNNISIDYKKKHYNEIYEDSLECFDFRVPMKKRVYETKEALKILK